VSDINYNISANVNKGELQLQLNAVGKTVTMSTAGFPRRRRRLGTALPAIFLLRRLARPRCRSAGSAARRCSRRCN
jgi:hypothetical protein